MTMHLIYFLLKINCFAFNLKHKCLCLSSVRVLCMEFACSYCVCLYMCATAAVFSPLFYQKQVGD